jgi:integrase
MKSRPKTLRQALERFEFYRQRSPQTTAWYRRVVSVYCTWSKGDVPLKKFNGESISLLLLAKEREGRSAYYLKSLRGGLVALLRDIRGDDPVERVRAIRVPPLDPMVLDAEEVEKLLASAHILPEAVRWKYFIAIALGYFTGLDAIDVLRIRRSDIGEAGALFFRRSKTGAPVFVRIPADLLALIDKHCPGSGPIVRLNVSREYFRRIVRKLFKHAGLAGSFKTLRKSSGSLVEQLFPGTGHQHLGNTRTIFEKHYEQHRITRSEPTSPPLVKLPVSVMALQSG